MTREAGAIERICACVAASTDIPAERIGRDDDLIDDIGLDEIELESLALVVEEVFGIAVPEDLWKTPLYRTPAGLAEWCVRKCDEAAWTESRFINRQRRA